MQWRWGFRRVAAASHDPVPRANTPPEQFRTRAVVRMDPEGVCADLQITMLCMASYFALLLGEGGGCAGFRAVVVRNV